MKILIWLIVLFVFVYFFFPEVENSMKCGLTRGHYIFSTGICNDISERVCKEDLGGKFLGCGQECVEDVLSVRKCIDKCYGKCQTKTHNNRWSY